MKHDQYRLLCNKVTKLFPKEAASAYYIPYVLKRNSGSSKGILAKERFVDKITNLLYLCGDTTPHKAKRKLNYDNDAGKYSNYHILQVFSIILVKAMGCLLVGQHFNSANHSLNIPITTYYKCLT